MRNANYKFYFFSKTLKKKLEKMSVWKGWKASSEWEIKMRSSDKWKWKRKREMKEPHLYNFM
jgi:hypothetical protein